MKGCIRAVCFAALAVFLAGNLFSQTGGADQRGTIPEELLRPRRDEAPRYPIDTVIGPLGQGQASREAYEFARRICAALLAGNANASIFSRVNREFLDNSMNALNTINPRSFRIGNGREEPDGSVSFLVRFVGREEGITGELFVRFEERTTNPPPPAREPAAEGEEEESLPLPSPPPVVSRNWVFEDLILEEPRGRDEENMAARQRYDFSPYERFF